MDAKQLRYLVSNLEGKLREQVCTNRFLNTKEGIKTICQLRRLAKIADKEGLDLWADSNELRS